MAFQKTVHTVQALGQAGEFYDDTPRRATAYALGVLDDAKNAVGKVFTFDDSGTPVLGGTGKFAGILTHPKGQARTGLDPSPALPSGRAAELADMGRVIVITTRAAVSSSGVQYDATTGDIAGSAPENPENGMAVIPGATFVLFDAAANAPAVVQLDARKE